MNKKRFVLFLSLVLITSLLMLSLTSCIKLGLKTRNLISSLEEAGYTVNYVYRTPMTQGGGSKYKYEDILYVFKSDDGSASKDEHQIDGGDISGTSGTSGTITTEELPLYAMYAIYCANDATGDYCEEQCQKYIELSENNVKCTKWIVYRNDNIILCGHIDIVAIARGY